MFLLLSFSPDSAMASRVFDTRGAWVTSKRRQREVRHENSVFPPDSNVEKEKVKS